ncbi:MAG: hypothetical protein DRI95_13605 [Bacteroidetes bacterium]|nr:MAG: hypothetical protein DRI95_13605 [Bacteroidota bacterium]
MQNWTTEIQELKNYYKSLSGKIAALEKELERLIKVEDEIGVLVSSRRCLEVIVTDICEKETIGFSETIALKGKIDKLRKEKKVPSHIISSMLNLNTISTYGAHPKEFDSRQVRTVLINLITIIEWYLSYKGEESLSSKKKSVIDHPGELITTDPEQKYLKGEATKKPSRLKIWKIATYFSAIIIIVLGILYLINKTERIKDIPGLEKSIAVLPFENWSSDKEYAHIGDAMTDELILQLQYIEDFDRVLSRTSTLQYKDHKKPIPIIAEELGVSYIIEGSIQRKHENVSITVQVIRAINEDHIWAEEYTGKWKDIFTIQDKIAKQVAEELKAVLSPKEVEQINKIPTENIEAYNLYLRGRFFWHRRTEKDLNKSIDYFNQALALDSTYALAYAGLADTYFIMGWYRWYPKKEAYSKAKKYALKALSINKSISGAHATLGAVYTYHEWNWKDAEEELKLAVTLNPNDAPAHMYYSELLNILGKNTEARKQIDMALKLNPHFFIYHGLSAAYYLNNAEYKLAIEESLKAYEVQNRYYYMIDILICYIKLAMNEKAIDHIKGIISINANNDHEMLDKIYQKSGIEGVIYWFIDWNLLNETTDSYTIATLYASIGDSEKAIIYLKKYMETDGNLISWINNDHHFNLLKTDPRFQAMLKEMKLEE